jgi:hypothetical protein
MKTATQAPKRGHMKRKPLIDAIPRCICAILLECALLVTTNPMRAQLPQNDNNSTNQRKEEITKLLAEMRDPVLRTSHPEQVVRAVQRLGEMRSTEAIDDLVELLAFSRRFDWERDDMVVEIQPITRGNRYPATSALLQIGLPALPALVKVIEANNLDSIRGGNAMFAIEGIFRDEPIEGARYLANAAGTSSNEDSAKRLRRASETLKQLAAELARTKK